MTTITQIYINEITVWPGIASPEFVFIRQGKDTICVEQHSIPQLIKVLTSYLKEVPSQQ